MTNRAKTPEEMIRRLVRFTEMEIRQIGELYPNTRNLEICSPSGVVVASVSISNHAADGKPGEWCFGGMSAFPCDWKNLCSL